MAEPFTNYLTTALSAVQTAMTEYWDPRILKTGARLKDVSRYFRFVTRPWEAGSNYVHIRVNDVMLRTARFIGDMAVSGGKTLNAPLQVPSWAEWKIGQDDLMSIQGAVRHEFKTDKIIGASGIGPLAQMLSTESLADVTERVEIGLITGQSGALARVARIGDELKTYSDSWTAASTHARIWLMEGSPVLFKQGDVIDVVSAGGTYAIRGDTTEPSTTVTVKNVGFERGASGVYGYIDVIAGIGSTFGELVASSQNYYVLFDEEYDTDIKPAGAPVTSSSGTVMYGLRDWFIAETGSPGTLYNVDRTALGYQWANPIVIPNTTSTQVTLAKLDNLMMMQHQYRLDQEKLGGYVILCGTRMAQKLVDLTGVAERRYNGGPAAERMFANYGFDGVMVHNATLNQPIAIQGVRGMSEDRVYLIQPGVCNIIMPGGIQWLPWNDQGGIWQNEVNTSAARSTVYRADRVTMLNSLIELPRLTCAETGLYPD